MKKLACILLLMPAILLVSYKRADVNWKTMDIKTISKELKDLQVSYSKLTTYAVTINYITYDTKSNNTIHDRSNGYMIKSGIYSKSRLLGIYSVQNEKFRVTIDSSKKVIHISNAYEAKDPGFSINDYMKILNLCKTVKKTSGENMIGYRFETKNKEGLIAQELFIENGITKEVNVFYANEHFLRENNSIKKEIVYPRLQVLFSNYDQNIKVSKSDFTTEKIITTGSDKKLSLVPAYKGYKLIDGRVKK
jgi:hypothetical protein